MILYLVSDLTMDSEEHCSYPIILKAPWVDMALLPKKDMIYSHTHDTLNTHGTLPNDTMLVPLHSKHIQVSLTSVLVQHTSRYSKTSEETNPSFPHQDTV
jgi:hypothetical protein